MILNEELMPQNLKMSLCLIGKSIQKLRKPTLVAIHNSDPSRNNSYRGKSRDPSLHIPLRRSLFCLQLQPMTGKTTNPSYMEIGTPVLRATGLKVWKKLSLAGLAKLSRLRYSWLRFGLASADYRGLRVLHSRLTHSWFHRAVWNTWG